MWCSYACVLPHRINKFTIEVIQIPRYTRRCYDVYQLVKLHKHIASVQLCLVELIIFNYIEFNLFLGSLYSKKRFPIKRENIRHYFFWSITVHSCPKTIGRKKQRLQEPKRPIHRNKEQEAHGMGVQTKNHYSLAK